MAYGLKMFSARHDSKGKLVIPVSKIVPDDRHGLLCEFCDARITWVQAHRRNEKNVAAYLRLGPNAEHAAECANQIKFATETIVSQSKSIEGKDSLFLKKNDEIVFRMNVLVDADFEVRKAKKELEETTSPEEKERKRTLYRQSKDRLSDYFNSAAGIAKIRARIEESNDKKVLSDLVKIEFNNKKISWNDFFYDEDRYPILFKKASKIKHPVAMALSVKTACELIKNNNNEFFSLKGNMCVIDGNEDGIKDYFAPALNSKKSDLLDNLYPEDELIIVGRVNVSSKPWKHIEYKNIIFWISNKKQLTKMI